MFSNCEFSTCTRKRSFQCEQKSAINLCDPMYHRRERLSSSLSIRTNYLLNACAPQCEYAHQHRIDQLEGFTYFGAFEKKFQLLGLKHSKEIQQKLTIILGTRRYIQ